MYYIACVWYSYHCTYTIMYTIYTCTVYIVLCIVVICTANTEMYLYIYNLYSAVYCEYYKHRKLVLCSINLPIPMKDDIM